MNKTWKYYPKNFILITVTTRCVICKQNNQPYIFNTYIIIALKAVVIDQLPRVIKKEIII